MMRTAIVIALLLGAACTGEHAATIDRLDCATCHLSLYEDAPMHVANDYPTTCYQCHGLTDWTDATREHDDFRIDRDPHAGYDCSACHASRDNRSDITCTSCHWHSAARTDLFHLGNGDYTYAPRACIECHSGEGD